MVYSTDMTQNQQFGVCEGSTSGEEVRGGGSEDEGYSEEDVGDYDGGDWSQETMRGFIVVSSFVGGLGYFERLDNELLGVEGAVCAPVEGVGSEIVGMANPSRQGCIFSEREKVELRCSSNQRVKLFKHIKCLNGHETIRIAKVYRNNITLTQRQSLVEPNSTTGLLHLIDRKAISLDIQEVHEVSVIAFRDLVADIFATQGIDLDLCLPSIKLVNTSSESWKGYYTSSMLSTIW